MVAASAVAAGEGGAPGAVALLAVGSPASERAFVATPPPSYIPWAEVEVEAGAAEEAAAAEEEEGKTASADMYRRRTPLEGSSRNPTLKGPLALATLRMTGNDEWRPEEEQELAKRRLVQEVFVRIFLSVGPLKGLVLQIHPSNPTRLELA